MKVILSMFDLAGIGGLVSRVRKLTVRNKFDDAIREVSDFYDKAGVKLPSKQAPVFINVLFAELLERTSRPMEAYEACLLSLSQIKDRSYSDKFKLGIENEKYLMYQCKWILSGLSEFSDSPAFKLATSLGVTFSDMNFKMVDKQLKSLFPIDGKFGEDLDDFILKNSNF